MDTLTAFGVTAVTVMLLCYALEDRSPIFTLWFAGACVASSIYGFLQGAWPFGVVEAIWTGVAVQRWRSRTRGSAMPAASSATPIACDMHAFTSEEGARYRTVRGRVIQAVAQVVSTPTGFRARLERSVTPSEVAEWMELERRCCPFLNLTLRLDQDNSVWTELDGGPGVKEFLQTEFASLRLAR